MVLACNVTTFSAIQSARLIMTTVTVSLSKKNELILFQNLFFNNKNIKNYFIFTVENPAANESN